MLRLDLVWFKAGRDGKGWWSWVWAVHDWSGIVGFSPVRVMNGSGGQGGLELVSDDFLNIDD